MNAKQPQDRIATDTNPERMAFFVSVGILGFLVVFILLLKAGLFS